MSSDAKPSNEAMKQQLIDVLKWYGELQPDERKQVTEETVLILNRTVDLGESWRHADTSARWERLSARADAAAERRHAEWEANTERRHSVMADLHREQNDLLKDLIMAIRAKT